MEAKEKNTPISNLELEDESLFDYINNIYPLKTEKYIEDTQTLNSLGMDHSLLTSPNLTCYQESIYSHEEAPIYSTHAYHDSNEQQQSLDTMISTADYQVESSSEQIEFPQAMQCNSGSLESYPLLSVGEVLSLFDQQYGADIDVSCLQNGSMKDSVEANIETKLPQSTTNSNYKMQTVDPVASQPIAAATDRNQTQDNLANVALMDSNPIERVYDELVRIRHSLQRNNSSYTSKSINGKTFRTIGPSK